MRQAFRDFEVVAPLVRGEHAVVYAATERATGRKLALKIFSPAGAAEGERAPLGATAWLEGRLAHPSVVRVAGFNDEGEEPFLATEWVEGRPLDAAIWSLAHATSDPGPLPGDTIERVRKIVPLFAGVADALDEAYRQGALHGRLYPWNLLLAEDGERLQLTDFGPERESGGRLRDRPGELTERLFYLAPEQRGSEFAPPDVQTDVYALGVVLYEAVTLCLPHDATDPRAFREQGCDSKPIPARLRDRAIPEALEAILTRCLAGDRARRYASFVELRDALTGFLAPRAAPPAVVEVEALDEAGAMPPPAAQAPPAAVDVEALDEAGAMPPPAAQAPPAAVDVEALDEAGAMPPPAAQAPPASDLPAPAVHRPVGGIPAPELVAPQPARTEQGPPHSTWIVLAALTAASCWLLVLAASRWSGQAGAPTTPSAAIPSPEATTRAAVPPPDRVAQSRAASPRRPRAPIDEGAATSRRPTASARPPAADPVDPPPSDARTHGLTESPAGEPETPGLAIAAEPGPPGGAEPLLPSAPRRPSEPEPPRVAAGPVAPDGGSAEPEDLRQAPYHPFGFGDPQVELTGMHGVVCDPRSGLPASGAVVVLRGHEGGEILSPPSDGDGGYSMPVEAGFRYEPVAVIAADGVRLPARWRGLAIRIWSGRYVEVNLCDEPGAAGSPPGDDGFAGSARSTTGSRTVSMVAARGFEPRT